MAVNRLLRHIVHPQWRARMLFPSSALDSIERAVARAELTHAAEIRFAIEPVLSPLRVIKGMSARERAVEVFALLNVWDTESNNGVLIYVLLADRSVEIVADRGLRNRVASDEWEAVCRVMEGHYRAGRYETGSIAGVDAVGTLLATHFPRSDARHVSILNQLPDRPTLL